MKQQSQIDIKNFQSTEGFIRHYQELVRDTVIPYQYAVLHDRIEGVEKSHVVANFENAAKAVRGEDVGDGFYGMVFQDSDAAKWIEAAAYSLVNFPQPRTRTGISTPTIPLRTGTSAGRICWRGMSFTVQAI